VLSSKPQIGASGAPGSFHALVIGNNAYTHLPALSKCVNDAQDMADLLASKGYAVTLVKDGCLADMQDALEGFASKLQAGCTVVVYFSGHGVCVSDMNYLVPVDGAASEGPRGQGSGGRPEEKAAGVLLSHHQSPMPHLSNYHVHIVHRMAVRVCAGNQRKRMLIRLTSVTTARVTRTTGLIVQNSQSITHRNPCPLKNALIYSDRCLSGPSSWLLLHTVVARLCHKFSHGALILLLDACHSATHPMVKCDVKAWCLPPWYVAEAARPAAGKLR
jgi:hypothetical protein